MTLYNIHFSTIIGFVILDVISLELLSDAICYVVEVELKENTFLLVVSATNVYLLLFILLLLFYLLLFFIIFIIMHAYRHTYRHTYNTL